MNAICTPVPGTGGWGGGVTSGGVGVVGRGATATGVLLLLLPPQAASRDSTAAATSRDAARDGFGGVKVMKKMETPREPSGGLCNKGQPKQDRDGVDRA
ncbi:hypothetical protein [Variovorax boronicumulans]|uniref:hypothetical protein n=1 Tax=Variovorax boronicumulans TaxID=436515 RepID=UPI00214AAC81